MTLVVKELIVLLDRTEIHDHISVIDFVVMDCRFYRIEIHNYLIILLYDHQGVRIL